jgi:hypothetical protein
MFLLLKKKDFESDNIKRKEKRMKELSNTFDKLIRVNKYFLIVINSNKKIDKTKEKHLNQLK